MRSEYKKIYQNRALIITAREDSALILKRIFEKDGIKTTATISIYEAERIISQEMPYFVVTESILNDGNCGILFDKVKANSIFADLPFYAIVTNKTKEALTPLINRKFAGFILGDPKEAESLGKLMEIIKGREHVTPYFYEINEKTIENKIIIATEATIVGKSDNFLISKSFVKIDTNANILAAPKTSHYAPVMLRKANNIPDAKGEFFYNLFPCASALGQGLKWVMSLPDIDVTSGSSKTKAPATNPRILFYVPSKEIFDTFHKVFHGYNIELTYAISLANAINIMTADPTAYKVVYLHELLSDGASIQWSKFYSALSEQNKPALIIGTSSHSARSTDSIHYIRKPFGVGQFLNIVKAALQGSGELKDSIFSNQGTPQYIDIPCDFQAHAKLLAVDESGGVLKVNFPIFVGSKLQINHALFSPIWGDQLMGITSSVNINGEHFAKFELLDKTSSRRNFWEKMRKELDAFSSPSAA